MFFLICSRSMQSLMESRSQFTSIGGQAVIEGVMMRSPRFIAVAARKPDGRIVIRNRPYQGIATRYPILKKPVLRGVVTLVESMIQGMDALSFSANIAAVEAAEGDPDSAAVDGGQEELSKLAIATSIAFAFVMGMGLFVALPHVLTAWLTTRTADSPWFHLIDGVIKMSVLLLYVYLIALMKDIRRVFQYHGAEHKSIYAFEAGEELNVANARRHTTLHPRCGTSFLLFLVLISILVFSAVFPLLGLAQLTGIKLLDHAIMVAAKIVLMLPVAGLSYEFIKAAACRMDNAVMRALIWPGMVLQNLTTRQPDDSQLEVALASLKTVLLAEKRGDTGESQIEIAGLADLATVEASVAEFPE